MYETIEPFGDYWIIQQLAALLASVNNAIPSKSRKRHKPSDFLPKPYRKTHRALSPEQLLSKFKAFAFQHNAAEKMRRK